MHRLTCLNFQTVPKTARTRSWTSKEVNGGIFVWYHCDGESPSWDFPQIEEIHGGKFKYKGRVEHHTNTHIQVSYYFFHLFAFSYILLD